MTFVRLQLESNLNPVLFCIVGQHSQLRRVPQPSPGYSRRFHKTPWQDQFGYCCLLPWLNKPVSFRQVQCHHCIDSITAVFSMEISNSTIPFEGIVQVLWRKRLGLRTLTSSCRPISTRLLVQRNHHLPPAGCSNSFRTYIPKQATEEQWYSSFSAAALVLAAQLNRGWGAGTRYVRCM